VAGIKQPIGNYFINLPPVPSEYRAPSIFTEKINFAKRVACFPMPLWKYCLSEQFDFGKAGCFFFDIILNRLSAFIRLSGKQPPIDNLQR
jgi:hypothetical protein